MVGNSVGLHVGHQVGLFDGFLVGFTVGTLVGRRVGLPVGCLVGNGVGALDGLELGTSVGLPLGDSGNAFKTNPGRPNLLDDDKPGTDTGGNVVRRYVGYIVGLFPATYDCDNKVPVPCCHETDPMGLGI